MSKKIPIFICLAQLLSVSQPALCKPAMTMPSGGQLVKYFNPVHEKSYLNEKQDRLIKKKSFKVAEIPGIEPIANRDIGLYATVDLSKLPISNAQQTDKEQTDKQQISTNKEQLTNKNYLDQILAYPEVNGISCLLPWRMLEPDEENYQWQVIDTLLSACAKHSKQLILRVSTCGIDEQPNFRSDTPDWVFEAGVPSITYKGRDDKDHLMPIFWDGTYLAKWSNFVNELGKRYDKNLHIHSIGITGGGLAGGTNVIPNFQNNKDSANEIYETLKNEHGMNPRQLVSHWKYVADVFPRAFSKQHLNFDIDPPTPDRKGQDCLDEISDYLVYRYGQRVYLTRENIDNDKRGFDQYRVLLKLKNDTLTGYQILPQMPVESLPKVAQNAFDDGISFAEIPAGLLGTTDNTVNEWLTDMRKHIGYQLVLQELSFPPSLPRGKNLQVHFAFMNAGVASPKRPARELDKDLPSSYKAQIAIKNSQGKTLALLRHTPAIPTCNWTDGKPVAWDEDLKMPELQPGKYIVSVALIDEKTGHKLNFFNGKLIGNDLHVGTLEITQ